MRTRHETVALTQKEALRIIAEEPDASDKTIEDLEEAAKTFEVEANRKRRIAEGRTSATRRANAGHEAQQLHGHANVCRLAAKEIARLHCDTVGQAAQGWIRRTLLRGVRS